jgi:hypothetical protein
MREQPESMERISMPSTFIDGAGDEVKVWGRVGARSQAQPEESENQ